ncbi:hypothetical protein [uncultured Bifidobacterium sp.]|uniref:hypothetical protein n=1 Tax=uncultured Bifidobacterium sp. TaxID=165187 RepID=UPI002592145B|nr:hypothetical protein [uncultured Bifidobacterium sp.]
MKTFHRSTGRKLLTAVLISAVIIAVFVMLQLAAHTPQTTTTMEVYADYPVYASVSDSVSASDIIITGVPLNSREVIEYPRIDFETGTEESNPQRGLTWENIDIEAMSVPHIVTEFQVTDSIKGDVLPGTVINVTQVGGTVDGIKIREKNTIPLQEVDTTHGKQLLLLLNKHEDGTFDPINPTEGVLSVHSDGSVHPLRTQIKADEAIGATLDVYAEAMRQQ